MEVAAGSARPTSGARPNILIYTNYYCEYEHGPVALDVLASSGMIYLTRPTAPRPPNSPHMERGARPRHERTHSRTNNNPLRRARPANGNRLFSPR